MRKEPSYRIALTAATLAILATVPVLSQSQNAAADGSIQESTPESKSRFSVTATPAFVTEYMFRGVRLGGASFQPAVELSAGDLSVGLWANAPIADRVPGQSDPEFDPSVSYTIALSEKVSLEPGIVGYVFPNADTDNGFYLATFEPYLGVNITLGAFELVPKFYYDVILEGPTFELTANWSIPLEKLRTELAFSATAGTYFWDNLIKDASPRVKNEGSYYQIGITLPFKFGRHFELTPGVAYTAGVGNYLKSAGVPKTENPAAEGRVIGSLSVAYTF